jgi:hypothetical protein
MRCRGVITSIPLASSSTKKFGFFEFISTNHTDYTEISFFIHLPSVSEIQFRYNGFRLKLLIQSHESHISHTSNFSSFLRHIPSLLITKSIIKRCAVEVSSREHRVRFPHRQHRLYKERLFHISPFCIKRSIPL